MLSIYAHAQTDFASWSGNAPEHLFDINETILPECQFINMFDVATYKGTFEIDQEEGHVIGRTIIKGCDAYSLLWQAPSPITAFDNYRSDSLYFSTRADGIYFYDRGLFKQLTIPEASLPKGVNKIKFLYDQLFMLTDNELYQLDLNDLLLKNAFSGARKIDGFAIDAFNQIWIRSGDDILFNDVYFDPKAIDFSISKMNSQSNFDRLNQEATLDAGINVFKFETNFKGDQEKVEYQYQVNQAPWQSSDLALIPINVFKDGLNEVIFRLAIDGSPIAAKSIQLNKPISKNQNGFWKYVIGCMLGLIALLIFAFTRERNKRQTVLQRISRIRAERQLEKSEQKILQLEMNPHFLFNALNSIKGLIASGKSKEARLYLSKFGALMRTALSFSKEEKISLEQEATFLENYLAIEHMSHPDKFDYKININENIDPTVLVHGMLIQPIIENAIIHGIGPKETKGLIHVNFYKNNEAHYCSVEDDGVGMQQHEQNSDEHISYGIKIINERINKAGINEPMQIIDLSQEKEGESGTKVVLRIA